MPLPERQNPASIAPASESRLSAALAFARRALASPVAVYLGVSVLCRGVTFFLIPLYTHRLSLAEYGDLTLVQTAIALLPMMLTLGIMSAVPRAFFREKDRREGLRQAGHVGAWVAVTSAAAALLVEGVVFAFVPLRSGHSLGRLEVSCVLVASVGVALTNIPSVIFRAAQKPMHAALFQALEAFSIACFTWYFLVVRSMGLRGAIFGLASAYVVNGLTGAAVVFGYLGGRPGRAGLRDLVRFSFPFVPHFAANWAQGAADRWVLKGAGFSAALGAFALANQVLSPATMTVLAFHDYASAQMGEAFRGGGLEGLSRTVPRQRKQYFLMALAPTIACLAAVPLAPYIVGKTFVGAFWTLPFLAAIGLVDSQYYPNSNVLYFGEKTVLIPRVTVAAAAANVVLNLALIPVFGLAGALAARGTTIVARTAALAMLARRTLAKPAPETA